MPVPVPSAEPVDLPLFPRSTKESIDAARLSSWFPLFRRVTIPSTVIDLDEIGEKEAFLDWLDSDSIFLPVECDPVETLDDDAGDEGLGEPAIGRDVPSRRLSDASSSSSSSDPPIYRLPNMTAAINQAIKAHGGAIFPKLNWTSPRDAAFIIPQTRGPLCCSTPADVYLLLKSSDLIQHDLDSERAYEGVTIGIEAASELAGSRGMRIELVLRSFMEMNPSREVRCFVRNDILLGISQRDTNYYDHLQSPETRQTICETVRAFWEDEIWMRYQGGQDYVFDIYLSSDLSSAFLVDFNPYKPSTDPLLFTYSDLLDLLTKAVQPPPPSLTSQHSIGPERLPILRIIDSRSHPLANSAAPAFGSNMMPIEMVEMSQGRSMPEFAEAWNDAVARGMQA